MKHPDEFQKILRQVMIRELKHNYSQEQINIAVHDIDPLKLIKFRKYLILHHLKKIEVSEWTHI